MSKLLILMFLCLFLTGCIYRYDEESSHTITHEYEIQATNGQFTEEINEEDYTTEVHNLDIHDFEHDLFERVNNERAVHGLTPLEWNYDLANIAREHSRNMAQLSFFDFNCLDGVSSSERITNAGIPWRHSNTFIVRGSNLAPDTMNLPGDDILLSEDLSHIGIGFYHWEESQYERYLTIKFVAMPIRPCDETISKWEHRVLDLTNEYRAEYGLSPLIWDETLANAARLHSNDMADNNFMAHEGSDGSTIGERITHAGWTWRLVRENVAVGQDSPEMVVDGWINSPGHRKNILCEDIIYLGVGFYFLMYSDFHFHWTQKFGTPMR